MGQKTGALARGPPFQQQGGAIPANGDGPPPFRERTGLHSILAAAALAAPDQVIFAILAFEEMREDRSGEAGIIELDGEIGAILVAALNPAGADLCLTGIDAMRRGIVAGDWLFDDGLCTLFGHRFTVAA